MAQESEKSLVEKRARNAMLARDFALAERLYKSLLNNEPSNISYMASLGDVCVQQGDDNKAISYYEKVIERNPGDFKSLSALGAIYRRMKRYAESVEILHRALDTEINDVQVYYNFGFTYKEMGNYDKAIECFEKVISANPSDVLALNHLGAIYALRSEHERAVAVYKRALQIDQNHPILQLNMAHSLIELKRYDDAESALLAALRAKPAWREAADDYMGLLMKRQKVNTAATFAKKMMALQPDDVYLRHNLGNALLKQFDYAGAVNVLKDANKIDKENASILSDLAVAYEKNGDTDQAIDSICDAEKIAPTDISLQKKYAHILLTLNKPDVANSKIQKLWAVCKDDAETLDLLSQYFICKNDEPSSLNVMKKINAVAPKYTRHLIEAAERYYEKGTFDKAEKYAHEFLESRKENESEAYVFLGKIKEAQGDDETALDFYKRAYKSNPNNVLAKESVERLSNAMHHSTENKPNDADLLEKNNADEESQEFDSADDIPIYAESPDLDDVEETNDLFDLDLLGEKLIEPESEDMPVDFDTITESDEDLGESGPDLPHDLNDLMADEVPYDDDTPAATSNMAPDFDASSLYDDTGIGTDVSEPEPVQQTPPAPEMPASPPYNNQYEDEMRDILRKVRNIADDATDAARAAEQSAKAAEDAIEQLKKEREAISTTGNDDAKTLAEDAAAAAIEKMQAMLDEQKAAADALLSEIEPIADVLAADSLEVSNIETDTLSVGGKDIGELHKKVEEIADAQERLAEMYGGSSAAAKLLPGIIAMLAQGKNMAQFTHLLSLFKHIKDMAAFLPDDKRHEFMTSRIRLQLEFLIARLSGKPGLISTVNALRVALHNEAEGTDAEATSAENTETTENTGDKKDIVESVVSSLGILATSLDDKELAQALAESADDVLQKL